MKFPPRIYHRFFVITVLVLAAAVLYRNAWLGDDAFITFRVVDNFVNGLGLTWNPVERVQVYTHPLWLLLISGAYFFTREIFLTSLFVSIAVTLAAMVIFAFKIARTFTAAMLGLGLLLVSKSFIDYSTSGLENPLTYLIIVIFFSVYLKGQTDRKALLYLTLITSLAALNRLDTILLFLPVLVFYFIKLPDKLKSLKTVILGFLPLIIWEAFSLFYYGFPFPNTAYAKLNSGIGTWALIKQAGYYFYHLFMRSPVTALAIACAVLLNLRFKANRNFPLVVGIVLYLLYVLKIGGCFMTGRFFGAPFLISVLILSQYRRDRSHRAAWVAMGILIALGIFWPRTPLWNGADYGTGIEKGDWLRGISDERAAYFQSNGLLNVSFSEELPNTRWAYEGRQARKNNEKFISRCGIGQLGFCAGPDVYILDCHALADPLLSRLPITSFKGWRIGHFRRIIPQGYEATLTTSENRIHDKDLSRYYDVMTLIVRGKLFSLKRFKEIIKMNLGFYNRYIKAYLTHPLYDLPYDEVRHPIAPGTSYNHNACRLLGPGGIKIRFNDRRKDPRLEVSVDCNDEYRMTFFDDTAEVAAVMIPPTWLKSGGISVDTVQVPPAAADRGYDNVLIVPVKGDGAYSFGHLRYIN
ncbi:MAG: hypothetical protein JXA92_01295 [candidate division Zixibacteria bacterium]|nr:hypothetical protein [candidate division Zixibacteria bacterium]